MEKDASLSAIYPFNLCRAILEGARQQLRDDDRLTTGVHCIMPRPDAHLTDVQLERRVRRIMHIMDDEEHEHDANKPIEIMAMKAAGDGQYRDAITGQPLDPDMVRAARRKELEYFNSKHVWELRDRAEATEEELKLHVRDALAHFKTPQWVSFVDDLPKTATGKVQKYVLRGGKAGITRQ